MAEIKGSGQFYICRGDPPWSPKTGRAQSFGFAQDGECVEPWLARTFKPIESLPHIFLIYVRRKLTARRGFNSIARRLLKKTHRLRCARSPRSNVLGKYASARRFLTRLASEDFLSSLQTEFNEVLHKLNHTKGIQTGSIKKRSLSPCSVKKRTSCSRA
jgi:hypothetical protein